MMDNLQLTILNVSYRYQSGIMRMQSLFYKHVHGALVQKSIQAWNLENQWLHWYTLSVSV